MATTTETSRFRVEGMDCASCASKVDTAVRRLPGVSDVSVSVVGASMTVKHDGADLGVIAKKVTSLGYKTSELPTRNQPAAAPAQDDHGHDCGHDHDHDPEGHDHSDHDHEGHDHSAHDHSSHDHSGHDHAAPKKPDAKSDALAGMHGHDHGPSEGRWYSSTKAKLTILCAVAVAVAFVAGRLFPAFEQWAFIIAMFVGLIPIARRAWMGAINGSPFSIETLMTVAAVGAVFINAAEEAAIVVLLFLIGELLEGVATGRARASIKALANLVPRTALH